MFRGAINIWRVVMRPPPRDDRVTCNCRTSPSFKADFFCLHEIRYLHIVLHLFHVLLHLFHVLLHFPKLLVRVLSQRSNHRCHWCQAWFQLISKGLNTIKGLRIITLRLLHSQEHSFDSNHRSSSSCHQNHERGHSHRWTDRRSFLKWWNED